LLQYDQDTAKLTVEQVHLIRNQLAQRSPHKYWIILGRNAVFVRSLRIHDTI